MKENFYCITVSAVTELHHNETFFTGNALIQEVDSFNTALPKSEPYLVEFSFPIPVDPLQEAV